MLFLTLSDTAGVGAVVVSATSYTDAVEQIRQRYAGFGAAFVAETEIAVILPEAVARITPGDPPTVRVIGDAQTQQQIRNAAANALAANATYLAIVSPTNANVVAQVRALTQQVDGLIRLAVGDFSAAT